MALVPAESEGVSVSGFWSSSFLSGAESDQVTLTDVLVPPELLLRTSRSVKLTAAGESLLRGARRVLAAYVETLAEVEAQAIFLLLNRPWFDLESI